MGRTSGPRGPAGRADGWIAVGRVPAETFLDSLPRGARECQPHAARVPLLAWTVPIGPRFPASSRCHTVRNSCQIQALRGMRGVLTCDHEQL